MTLAADKTELINGEKLEKANNYIAELEEDLSSSRKMWAAYEMMTKQYENEMKKKMEELENLKMNYQKMAMQWKEEITKRDEEIGMQKKEIETLRNEKATVAVQVSTANRTIEINQRIEVSRAQNVDEKIKKYVVVVNYDGYNSLFEADNVVFIHSGRTDSLKDCISQNRASYHKEMFVLTHQYFTKHQANIVYNNLISICQQWKTLYPDAEIHVIGFEWESGQDCEPTRQIAELWTSYNEFILISEWERELTKAIAFAWSPHCYKLLSGDAKQLYLQ